MEIVLQKGDMMKESKIASLLSKKKKVKIYMTNKNLTEEEIEILKKQGKFIKCPYMGPKELFQTIK